MFTFHSSRLSTILPEACGYPPEEHKCVSQAAGVCAFASVREEGTRREEALKQKGGAFAEAPVSGKKKPAEDGQLAILAAGHKELYDDMVPAFDVLGKKC